MRYDKLPQNARAVIWCAVSTTRQAADDRASMDEQERWALEVCHKFGWQVVDVMRVPGHSRNYKDLNTLASDARGKGIDAFDRLIAHLEKADFDVFICRDANRFARRASLLHYVVESIIEDCGAVIYSQHDGWVDSSNAAGFAAMKGYSTTQDIQWMRNGTALGKEKLIKNGIPASGIMSSSHKRVRDTNTGKTTAIVLNDEMLDFYTHVGTLLLAGIPWSRMGRELYTRWGMTPPNGKFYCTSAIYYRLYNPIIWGNLATGRTKHRVGEWVFYDHPSKPPDLFIEYGVTPPVYNGKTARDVRDELKRRLEIRGKRHPSSGYRFLGICDCGVCGHNMVVASTKAPKHGVNHETYPRYQLTDTGRLHWGLTCQYRYHKTIDGNICTGNSIKQVALEKFFTELIYYMLDGKQLSDYFQHPDAPVNEPNIEQVASQIKRAREQIRLLIRKQSQAPESVQDIYQGEILHLSDQIENLEMSIRYLEASRADTDPIQAYINSDMRVEDLWELSDLEINQLLTGLMGDYRLIILGNEVVGMKLMC